MSLFGTAIASIGSLALKGVRKLFGNFMSNAAGNAVGKIAQGAGAFGLNYLNSRFLNAHLTGAQQEQNAFNASEADKNRLFNAEQAQINRDFQAEQAATQWQRGVSDMQAAGLNPALAYGQGGASAMSGATATGTPATGSNTNFGTSLSDMMQLMLLEKQGRLMDAEITGKELQNEGQDIANMLASTYGAQKADVEIRAIEQSIQESIAKTGEAATRSALNSAMADLTRVQARNEDLKAAELQWRKNFIEQWHMPPELAGDLAKSAAILVGAGINAASNVFKFFAGKPKPIDNSGPLSEVVPLPPFKVD